MMKMNFSLLFLLGLLLSANTIIAQEVFKVVEEMPRFPGCEDKQISEDQKKGCAFEKLTVFVSENLNYPKEAKEAGVEGTVVAQFVVQEDGSLSDVKIVRGIGGGCDEEVVRIVEAMPDWVPGMQRGREVKVMMNLPVQFKLPVKKATDK